MKNFRFYSTLKRINETKTIHIAFSDYINYNLDAYKNIFIKNLDLGIKYSYLVKVGKNNIYLTLSERQKFFMLDHSDNDEERFDAFENYLHTNLSRILEMYKKVIEGDCDIITFEFFPLNINNDMEDIKIKNIEDIQKTTSNINTTNIKKQFSMFDDDILNLKGTPLNVDFKNREFYTDIEGLELFIFDNIKYLEDSKFYLIKYRGKVYVIVEHIEGNTVIKQCLDKFGTNIHIAEETILDNGDVIRKLGNFHTHYNSNKEVIEVKKDITFNSISANFKLNDKTSVNDNIGVIDLETYKNEGISLCYAIGYYTPDESNMFYIDKDTKDSHMLIHQCIFDLLRTKFRPYTFYCHNLGGFDAPFIIKALLEYNKTAETSEKYTFDVFTRDSSIIRLTIRKRVGKNIRSLKIQDSLPILSMSLRDLCKAYKIEDSKSYFPYNFVNKNTLFYRGVTPDKTYYEVTHSKDLKEFNSFYENNFSNVWDLQSETLKYLELDLKSLHEVLKIVNLHMFLLFDIQMTQSSTISGIAMRTFLTQHYKDTTDKIPLINSNQIYNDIYKAYYGGRVEVFIPKPIDNEKLYYYDVNSLYPFASLNDLPGLNWSYNEYVKLPKLDNLFGFYYCKIKSNSDYLGLLPFRNKKGGLLFPKGLWYGWYFSEELKLAEKNGYEIEVLKGYTADKSKDVFKDFVNSIFQVKLNPRNNAEKNVAKLILNSLIGRFGMNPDKMITKLLNHKEHNIISSTRVLKNSMMLDNENYLDTFSTDVDKDVCEEFGLDYVKVLNSSKFDFKKAKPISNNTISISTAAAILSYSRIYMAETMSNILKRGGRIYYTDTDSIVTNIKLPNDMIDSKELGKFKLENELVEAYFISDKTYLIKNVEGKIIKKAKSVKEDSLDINDYKRFYNLEVYQSAIKTISKKDFLAGSVNISSKLVTLNVDKYTKRERLFKDNRWVNSKPIWVNEVDKSIIVYTPKDLILFSPCTSITVYTPKDLILFSPCTSITVYTLIPLTLTLAASNKGLILFLPYTSSYILDTQIKNTKAKDVIIVPETRIAWINSSNYYFNFTLWNSLRSNFWYKGNIAIIWTYKIVHKVQFKLYMIHLNLVNSIPKYIIFIYIILNMCRIPNFLDNTLHLSINTWFDTQATDLLFTEELAYFPQENKDIGDFIITNKNIDIHTYIRSNDESNNTLTSNIEGVKKESERLASVTSPQGRVSSIFWLFFKMLDFANLKYYPSLFQNYSFPKVFELNFSYEWIVGSAQTTQLERDLSSTSSNISFVSDSSINDGSTASSQYTHDINDLTIKRREVFKAVKESIACAENTELFIETSYKESLSSVHTPININHISIDDKSSLCGDDISCATSSDSSSVDITFAENLNRISGYDTPLNSNFLAKHTSLESELIGYTEDFDTSSITMVEDLCSLDVAIQGKTINLEELQSKVTDTYHLDIQSQLTILNNQITSYKDTLETRDITIRTLKLNTDNLNSRIEKLLKALVANDLKIIDLESKIDEDVYKIGELVNEIDSLKSNKTTLNEELDKFQELLHDNNKIIDSNYEELYSLKEQIIEFNRQISFLNNTKSEFEELLRSNDQELIEQYNETKVLKAKVEEYELKTNNILEELKLEKSKSEEYLEWYDDTSIQLDEAKAEISRLKREVRASAIK